MDEGAKQSKKKRKENEKKLGGVLERVVVRGINYCVIERSIRK